jgi:hypothetical protein
MSSWSQLDCFTTFYLIKCYVHIWYLPAQATCFCMLLLYIVFVLSTVSVVYVRADSAKGLWLLSQHVNK